MRTTAILPVKTFARAKQRIAPAIGGEGRAVLAEAMVADVLAALSAAEGVHEIVVVTAEPRAVELAAAAGAAVVPDRSEAGHVAAAVLGIDRAVARRSRRVLLVPGDCPTVEVAELEALLSDREPESVVIVPDRHGTGSNALLLTPPDVMVPAFGPGSCARHAALAAAAGASVRIAELESLALDVDAPEDLPALAAALRARPELAPRTRAALASLALLGAA